MKLRTFIIWWLAALLLVYCSSVSHAQTTGFEKFGLENGLAGPEVTALVQDNYGTLWIGGISGLSRYDGHQLTTFTTAHGLAHNWVTAAERDQQGNVWFGHINGTVSVFRPDSETPESVGFGPYGEFHTITDLLADSKGRLWVATNGGGLFIYDVEQHVIDDLPTEGNPFGNNIAALATDANGTVWAGGNKGLFSLAEGMKPMEMSSWQQRDTVAVTALAVSNDKVSIGGRSGALRTLPTTGSGTAQQVSYQQTLADSAATGSITALCHDPMGYLWVGTEKQGVVRLPSAANGVSQAYSLSRGLNFNHITAVLPDREGNTWIGTRLGLNRYRSDRFLVYETSEGLAHNIVWSVMQDRDKRMWFGTNDGISVLSFAASSTSGTHFTSQTYTTADGLCSNVTLCLHQAPDGTVWAGSNGLGVSKLVPGSNRWEVLTTADGLTGNIVFSIASDSEGNVWFGTMGGASKLDAKTGTISRYTDADGLGGNNVYTIYPDRKGSLWFGMLGGYLSRYRNGSFRVYDESYGIKQRFIQSIAEDGDGNLWFGANEGGIYRYDGTQFQYFPLENADDPDQAYYVPYSVTCDASNGIWIGTSRGIARLDQESQTFHHYDESDGFLGVETNSNATTRDANGHLWFGTIMGAVRFAPEEDSPNAVPPVTRISGLKIFHESAAWPESQRFGASQNHITFEFAGVSLTNPARVRYQYKLENFDSEWSPETSSREAVYANLQPGSYVFKVRAANESGLWNSEPVSYGFTVLAPFWQQAWFFLLCLCVVFLTLFLYVRARALRFKTMKTRLEAQVKASEASRMETELQLKQSRAHASEFAASTVQALKAGALPGKQHFAWYQAANPVSGDCVRVIKQQGQTLLAAFDTDSAGNGAEVLGVVAHTLLGSLAAKHGIGQPQHLLAALLEELPKAEASAQLSVGLFLFDEKAAIGYAANAVLAHIVRAGKTTALQPTHQPLAQALTSDAAITTLDLTVGDLLYIHTNGYLTQVNGTSNNAFSEPQFVQLLGEIAERKLAEQEIILKERFRAWRGSAPQTDDVVMLGVET